MLVVQLTIRWENTSGADAEVRSGTHHRFGVWVVNGRVTRSATRTRCLARIVSWSDTSFALSCRAPRRPGE
jgi:hypothetical protein